MTFIGNQDAGPVLRELAADDNEHVAALALEIWTLNKLNPDIGNRPLEWSMFPTYWQRLICKHNIKHKGIEKLLD
jgi:hypothetical protein